jgi:hypothetical protein
MKKPSQRFAAGADQGSSMVFALLVLLAILTLGIAGLSAASFGLTLANNYSTGIQATQAAESGLVHAVSTVNGYGVRSFTTDVAPTSNWNSIFGTSAIQMPGYSNITYTVTPLTNPAATSTKMWITAVGQAPGQSSRTLNARLALTQPFTCGAIDLPSEGVSSNFNGNNFSIDGNDYAVGGTTPIAGSTPTLGISTRTQTDANSVLSSLSNGQQDNVAGTSVPNQIASVGPCQGPSNDRITNTIVPTILAQGNTFTYPTDTINGNVTLGTVSAPRITYFNGDTTIQANGDASGAGILIVHGSLTISGNFDFTGLVIVDGTTQITTVTGNATIYGAVWTTDLSLTVGGSAAVRYSDGALSLANSIPGVAQPLLPQKVAIVAWSNG